MIRSSKIYVGLQNESILHMYGVQIPDLRTFTSIIKTDEEFTIGAFLKMFKDKESFYDKATLMEIFNEVEPLDPKEIFSERFSNVEVRAVILKYVSPDKVFKAVESKVIEEITLEKSYPHYEIKNLNTKKDSAVISSNDIVQTTVKRTEKYSLIEITDKKVLEYLPWRSREAIYMLQMECPSSKKTYYEYIHPDVVKEAKGKVGTVKKLTVPKKEKLLDSICWQLKKADGNTLSKDEYKNILSET